MNIFRFLLLLKMCVSVSVYFWRQHFILCTVLICNISTGFLLAFPSVLNPSILAQNGTGIKATTEEATWIASSSAISAMPAFVVLPIMMQSFGRKITNIVLNFSMMVGWIIFYFAQDTVALFTARIVHGAGIGATLLNVILIAEYSDPKRRGYFIVAKKLFIGAGVCLCHVLYLRWSWRHIALTGFVCNLMSLIMTLTWPESPAYLAMKSKFRECEESFVWIRGTNNKKELEDMIQEQKEKLKYPESSKKTTRIFIKMWMRRDSLKAFFISILLIFILEASGRHYFAAYLMQMILDLLGNKSLSVYITIGNDLISVLGIIISVILVNYLKRRTLLFWFGGLSVIVSVIISLTLILKSSNLLASPWLTVSFLLIFNLVANIGVIPISFALMGEVYPLDLKGIGVSVSGLAFSAIISIYLKFIPFLNKHTGMPGTFLINACIASISLLIMYFILPETKDRTLLDIENDLKGEKKIYQETKSMLLSN